MFVQEHEWESVDVVYEDLVQKRAETIYRIASFLETPVLEFDSKPEESPLKQTPTDLRRLLENFEDLRKRYEGTRFQAMIEDTAL
jgi:hypothetical protein